MNNENEQNFIQNPETQKTIAAIHDVVKIPEADRMHLQNVLHSLPEKVELIKSPYAIPSPFAFLSKLQVAIPVGAFAVLLLILSVFHAHTGNIAVAPLKEMTPAETQKTNVDTIVATTSQNGGKETTKAVQKTVEDKNLALRDKQVLNSLSTNYDDAF